MNKPVIVDLLPPLQVVVHPDDALVIKSPGTIGLSIARAELRAHAIVQTIVSGDVDVPDPLTFYVSPDWQAFAIIAAVSAYFDMDPRVLMMDTMGEITDLVEFYSGDMFTRHRIRKEVRPNNVISHKGAMSKFVPNSNQPYTGGTL